MIYLTKLIMTVDAFRITDKRRKLWRISLMSAEGARQMPNLSGKRIESAKYILLNFPELLFISNFFNFYKERKYGSDHGFLTFCR